MNHSIYGPSGAKRWIACPGSIKACEVLPDQTSVFAEEGHRAHDLAEKALKSGKACTELAIDVEMAECVQSYVDYVEALGGQQEYEQQISFEDWVPGGFGTADAIVIDNDNLHVIDLKYGKGVKVDADDNPQGKLYALGALSEREVIQNFTNVIIHIVQPRLNHVSVWETTPKELYSWADNVVKKAVEFSKQDNPPLNAGDHCRFCKAKPTCSELSNRTEHALMKTFDDFACKPREIKSLNDSELRFILNQKPLIIEWLNSIEKHVEDKLKAGETFPGFKLVHGRSLRKWSDETEAEKVLFEIIGENAYEKKLLSPAKAEKAIGKEGNGKLKNLIIKPPGSPTMVSENDEREPIQITTADDFNF